MTDPLAHRIHELLGQVMDIDASQRSEFLRTACGEHPELAGRVEQLLAVVADSQSFLEQPALQVFGIETWTEQATLPSCVGNYELGQPLGSGGMGAVYEAVQRHPNRTVALKIPRIGRWRHDFRQQMQHESEVLARLRHAYIAQVYEAGVDDSRPEHPLPFFAMEFVPSARTIRQYVREKQLRIPEILSLIGKVCEAVQHAHRLGIIHRDLKPANILVDVEGNPKIIDFGVASSLGYECLNSEQSLPLAGTPSYMSPEQCDSAATIDARTDIYSIGVILYELLCQTLPYDLAGKPIMDALQIVKEQSPRPALRNGRRLPTDIEAILHKALEKDRDLRYSTVEAVSEDINRYLQRRPVRARRAAFWYPLGLAIQRHRWMAIAIGLLAIAISTGSVGSFVFALRMTDEVQRRRLAESNALRQRDEAVWQSYTANMHGAFAAFQNGEVALTRNRLATAPAEHRNWEWDYLTGMVEVNEQVIQADQGGMICSFACSPDRVIWATGSMTGRVQVWDSKTGLPISEFDVPNAPQRGNAKPAAIRALAFRSGSQQIVAGTGAGDISIWNVGTATLERWFTGHRAGISTLSVHADGRILSTCLDGRAKLWNAEQHEPLDEIKEDNMAIFGALFCGSGKRLVSWGVPSTICLRDATTFEIIERFEFTGNVRRVAASADGSWIAAGGSDNRIQIWKTGHASTEERVIEIEGNRSSTNSLCFSPDGTQLTVGRIDRQIFQYSVEELSKSGHFRGHEEFVFGLCYSPSGDRLISASGDGTLRVWNLETGQLGNARAASEHGQILRSVALSPSGNRIAVAAQDRFVRVYNTQLELVYKLHGNQFGATLTVAWSPQGTEIATAGVDRRVQVWNTQVRKSQKLEPPHTGPVNALAYSPDGKWLVSASSDRTLQVWKTSGGDREFQLHGHQSSVHSLRFSNDGRWLASGAADGSIILWDWSKREVAHRLSGHLYDVFALVFTPDSSRLYSGSRDRTVRVWSTQDGQPLGQLADHGQLIRCLDIHPDGTRLVAGSWFGDISIWDTERHELVASFKGHADIVHDLAFSPDGSFLVSCSQDKTLKTFTRHRYQDGRPAVVPMLGNGS